MTIAHATAGSLRAVALILLASIASLAPIARTADAASSVFDKPLQVVRVKLPPDPLNPQARARVSCFYFAHVMVKEVDLGEKGADQLSIVPLGDGPLAGGQGKAIVPPRECAGREGGRAGRLERIFRGRQRRLRVLRRR